MSNMSSPRSCGDDLIPIALHEVIPFSSLMSLLNSPCRDHGGLMAKRSTERPGHFKDCLSLTATKRVIPLPFVWPPPQQPLMHMLIKEHAYAYVR